MSETNKKHVKRRFSPYPHLMALLAGLVSWHPTLANGQDISAYGTSMCAEIGIPADDCTLSGPIDRAEVASGDGRGDKTVTLVEHARQVCAQENVPIEDCQALPIPYRQTARDVLPAAPFLTVPERLPAVDPGLVPVPVIADAPIQAPPQTVRYVGPPPEPPLRYAAPPPVDPGIRYIDPPPLPADPAFRYVDPPLPPADVAVRDVPGPVERPLRALRRPVLVERRAEPVFEPAPIVVEERPERFRRGEPSGRCLRAVRYSRPPSYRYVTC